MASFCHVTLILGKTRLCAFFQTRCRGVESHVAVERRNDKPILGDCGLVQIRGKGGPFFFIFFLFFLMNLVPD